MDSIRLSRAELVIDRLIEPIGRRRRRACARQCGGHNQIPRAQGSQISKFALLLLLAFVVVGGGGGKLKI